jgi:hypothetical protein
VRLQRLTSSRLTHQISAHSVFLSLLPRLASASHFTISQRFLDITQNIHFNVASHHATHTYIDNGQIVARMDKSVIPEEEVQQQRTARFPHNRLGDRATAIVRKDQVDPKADRSGVW